MSGQNTSTAVMQQRSEPHDSLDDFPTPPWATRALCEFLHDIGEPLYNRSCREPAANRGHMVKPLQEYFRSVDASDIHDYGAGYPQNDYLFGLEPEWVDWTITNPPFRLAEQFIDRARRTSLYGCAMIVRSAFLEGQDRCERLFLPNPPAYVLQFSERVGMFRGRLTQVGTKFIDALGVERTAATATAYCWIVWIHGKTDTQLRWIPPCRKRLERALDYEATA